MRPPAAHRDPSLLSADAHCLTQGNSQVPGTPRVAQVKQALTSSFPVLGLLTLARVDAASLSPPAPPHGAEPRRPRPLSCLFSRILPRPVPVSAPFHHYASSTTSRACPGTRVPVSAMGATVRGKSTRLPYVKP